MCVILASKEGQIPDWDILEQCAFANSDGVGIAWNDGEYLRVRKSLRFHDSRIEDAIKDAEGHPYILHFRLATHGETHEENSHPFWLLDDKGEGRAVLAHNGILSGYGSKTLVDTVDYINRKLPEFFGDPKDRGWMDQDRLNRVGDDIGSNKFAILDLYGKVKIVNAHLGDIVKGYPDVWFSNTNWRWERKYYPSAYAEPVKATSKASMEDHFEALASQGWDWDSVLGEWVMNENHPRYGEPSNAVLDRPDPLGPEDLEDLEDEAEAPDSEYWGPCDFCRTSNFLYPLEGAYFCEDCVRECDPLYFAALATQGLDTQDGAEGPLVRTEGA